jgi:hypothetical protein
MRTRNRPTSFRLAIIGAALIAFASLIAVPARAQDDSLNERLVERAQPLLKALSLVGTPYRYGGNDPERGLDCSGFVKHVYQETAGVRLPRNARDMSARGEQIDKTDLKPGDLVFFNTRKQPFSHVGIYKGDGEFIHASSRREKSVTVSRIDSSYWATRFDGARRLLSLD